MDSDDDGSRSRNFGGEEHWCPLSITDAPLKADSTPAGFRPFSMIWTIFSVKREDDDNGA